MWIPLCVRVCFSGKNPDGGCLLRKIVVIWMKVIPHTLLCGVDNVRLHGRSVCGPPPQHDLFPRSCFLLNRLLPHRWCVYLFTETSLSRCSVVPLICLLFCWCVWSHNFEKVFVIYTQWLTHIHHLYLRIWCERRGRDDFKKTKLFLFLFKNKII